MTLSSGVEPPPRVDFVEGWQTWCVESSVYVNVWSTKIGVPTCKPSFAGYTIIFEKLLEWQPTPMTYSFFPTSLLVSCACCNVVLRSMYFEKLQGCESGTIVVYHLPLWVMQEIVQISVYTINSRFLFSSLSIFSQTLHAWFYLSILIGWTISLLSSWCRRTFLKLGLPRNLPLQIDSLYSSWFHGRMESTMVPIL